VGFSNQFIGKIAKKIAISFPESAEFFPSHKTVLTGNLIRKQLLQKNPKKPEWFTETATLPLLYITGGSQGSEVINTTVSQMLSRILKDWQVIHQCGTASESRSYLSELEQKKSQLTKAQRERFFIREWVSELELAWIYKHATAAISRAGANTTQELTYNRLPAILIPLPFSHYQEQQKNAEALSSTGGAILIPQKHLSPETLLTALETIRTKNQACRRKLAELTVSEDADQKLYTLITEIVPAAREKKD
jgi:UDP-N-acetylglucosamine--N-acetylmuramyl-(pentapeptide) pyrophosphoryl-undecaprenol N-acetylglucosamine transferase